VLSLPFTQAGMPAVAVPAGTTGAGLPLGLQLVGRRGDDERLLAWAEGVAQVCG
jgi:Asp-tRNA(Asn)/Glu-tRNA(Gln) amidotransferase A subunit family amidase